MKLDTIRGLERRRWLRETGAFLLFLALSVIYTWPLAAQLRTLVSDNGEPLLNAWILDWVSWATWHQPFSLFQAPIFSPALYPLAYSENLLGITLLLQPFHLAGCAPVTLHNLGVLFGFAFSGFGAYVLGRHVSGSMIAGVIGGLLYGFTPYRFDHLAHVQVIWSGWLPLLLTALLVYWKRPSWLHASLLGIAFLMNGLSNIYFLLFGSVAAALTLLMLVLLDGLRLERRFWIRLAAALLLATALLYPILRPYQIVSDLYGMRRADGEVAESSAAWSDWLIATPRSALYGRLPAPESSIHERRLFPGAIMLLLAACGALFWRREDDGTGALNPFDTWLGPPALIRICDSMIVILLLLAYIGAVSPRVEWTLAGHRLLSMSSGDKPFVLALLVALIRISLRFPRAWRGGSLRDAAARSRLPVEAWACALWIAVGVEGSRGLNGFFYRYLWTHFEVFHATRVPARWAMIAYVGLAAFAALGVATITRRAKSEASRAAVAAGLFVLALADLTPRVRWNEASPEPAPVYRWLRTKTQAGPVLELPIGRRGSPFLYTLAQRFHERPILNGTSGFEPPPHRDLRERMLRFQLDDDFTSAIERYGGALIIVHAGMLGDQDLAVRKWLRQQLSSGRLHFVRRFDHDVSGDWVFAVTRNELHWQSLIGPQQPDGAGNLPDENLARMLAGKPTYSASVFGVIDSPGRDEEPHGTQRFAGWALSPNGIAEVTLLLQDRRFRIPTELGERSDVEAYFPWYPKARQCAWIVSARRPREVPRETYLEVEIVDKAGRRTILPGREIDWN
jgi:hypothetical protein